MRKLQLILGYSSTGKSTLTFSGIFENYIFTPLHHFRISSNSDVYDSKQYDRFNETIFSATKNKSSWMCTPEKKFKKLFGVIMQPTGLKTGHLNQIVFAKNMIRFFNLMEGLNVLIEGEFVTKHNVFDLIVSIARGRFQEIDVILLTRKWKHVIPVATERRGAEHNLGRTEYSRFYEKLIELLERRLEKGVISSLKVGPLDSFMDLRKQSQIMENK